MSDTPATVSIANRTEPPLLRECTAEARRCLREAAERSVDIPDETLSVLIGTERALDSGGVTAAQEERFWKAYAYLRTNVVDLRSIRRRYNLGFVGLLLLLLAFQSIHISATSMLDAVKAQWAVVLDHEVGGTEACQSRAAATKPAEAPLAMDAAKAPATGVSTHQQPTSGVLGGTQAGIQGGVQGGVQGCPTRVISEPEYGVALAKLLSYDHLLKTGHALLPWGATVPEVPVRPPSREALNNIHHFVSLGALANARHFLELFILPALYGALGACAFVLRRFSSEQQQGAILNDSGIRYGLRISIGVIAGLAIHWLIRPAEGADAAHASASMTLAVQHLSRYALSFVAGYGSEVVFNILDRLVVALAPGRQTGIANQRAPASPSVKVSAPEADESSTADAPKWKPRQTAPVHEEAAAV